MTNPESQPLRVLMLAAEADPLIKVGGLGDVAGSLPRALRRLLPDQAGGRTLDVRLAIPFHAAIRARVDVAEPVAEFSILRIDRRIEGRVYEIEVDGVPVYLIDGPPFQVDMPVYLYDTPQDADRYTFFSLAALEWVCQSGWHPDVIHANDWHTSIAVYALHLWKKTIPALQGISTLVTVHNLPFMGVGAGPALSAYGLPPIEDESLPPWARHFPLPLGLATADHITSVSPTYSREILTPEFGCGLQNFLQTRAAYITGILNGLDQSSWDPAADMAIVQPYSLDMLEQRRANKRALLDEFGLLDDEGLPLMVMIGRMDPQKGVDLTLEALRLIGDLPWQAIILGSGDPLLEEATRRLEADFPDRVRATILFDPNLSRRMYASADMLLMPSRYEPCGLAQMIAMRYGCIPVARSTGGLRDTIQDTPDLKISTGILFEDATVNALDAALRRALALYTDQSAWKHMQANGMQMDFSWERSALQYAHLYRRLLNPLDEQVEE